MIFWVCFTQAQPFFSISKLIREASFEEVIQKCQELDTVLQAPAARIELYIYWSECLLEMAEGPEALAKIQMAQQWEQDATDSLRIRLLIQKAYSLISSEQIPAAKAPFDQAEALAEQAQPKLTELYIKSQLGLGYWYRRRRAFKQAREKFDWVRQACKKLPEDSEILPHVLRELGDLQRQTNQYDTAIVYYDSALAAFQFFLNEHHPRIAYLNLAKGLVYRLGGRHREGLKYLEKSVEATRRCFGETHLNLARTYSQMGSCWFFLEDFWQALSFYQQALYLYQKHLGNQHRLTALAHNDLGLAYGNLHQYQASLDHYAQALEAYAQLYGPQHRLVARAYSNLGICYQRMGQHSKAESVYKQALDIYLALPNPNPVALASTHTNIGRSQFEQQHYKQALASYDVSYQIRKAQGESGRQELSFLTLNIGECWLAAGNRDSAAYYLYGSLPAELQKTESGKKAQLPPFHQIVSAPILARNLKILAALQKSGPEPDQKQALETLLLATALVDSQRQNYDWEQTALILADSSVRLYENVLDIATDLYQKSGDQQYLEIIYTCMETSKSNLLKAGLNQQQAQIAANIPQEIQEAEDNLQKELAEARQAFLRERDQDKRQELEQLQFAIRQKYDSLIQELEQTYPNYYALKYANKTPSLAELQQFLTRQGSDMVLFFQGSKKVYALYVQPDQAVIHSQDWNQNETDNLLAFINQLRTAQLALEASAEDIAAWNQASSQIYQKLLAPLLIKGKDVNRPLVIVPDGYLSFLPFELLLTESVSTASGDIPYLLYQGPIVYQYAAHLFMQSEDAYAAQPDERFLGYAPSYSGSDWISSLRSAITEDSMMRTGFAPLLFNQKEVQDLAILWNGTGISAEKARKSHFKKYAPEAQILHLAMHAFTHDEEPAYSGLVFSGETENQTEILYAYELYTYRLKAELAVLSACNTGFGKLQPGEGIMSLARAFRYAGCPNIVMSLWPADDQATVDLMRLFHGHLHKGMSKSSALQQAKIDYLNSHDRIHPFYWAGFVLVGDHKPLSSSSALFLWLIAGVIVSAGLVWLWKNKKKFRV